MPKVSVLIPSRAETRRFSDTETVLQRTVRAVYEAASGDIEVIVGFDGPPYQSFPDYPRLRLFHFEQLIGLKKQINTLAERATGKYLFKLDAHTSVAPGFDETLVADMQDNWVVTPRFYVLDGATWEWQDARHYDYFYLCCPFTDKRGFRFKAGGHWPERTAARLVSHPHLDETPQMHGSGWFVNREFFLNEIGGFPTIDPFGHAQEPPYLGLKTWLGPWGGAVMVNKNTWYAHLHQQGDKRGYSMGRQQERASYAYHANYWMGNEWAGRKHNMTWFIEKFMPMPSWPDNWRELYADWIEKRGLQGG